MVISELEDNMRILAVLLFLGFGTMLVAQDRVWDRSTWQRGDDNSQRMRYDRGQSRRSDERGERSQWTQQEGQPSWRNGSPSGQPPWGEGPPPWIQNSSDERGRPPQGISPFTSGSNTDRTSRMIGMLRSMDANRNGILEPNEISDSRRGFVNAIITRLGGTPNGQINLADLERRALANATSSTQSGRSGSESTGQQLMTPTVEPLVPPFGEKGETETPVLGFGQREKTTTTPVTTKSSAAPTASNQAAQATVIPTMASQSPYNQLPEGVRNNPSLDWFFEYDKDQDTQLTMQEYINGRGGVATPQIATEFLFLDRNRDGIATIAEVLASLKEADEQLATETARHEGSTPSVGPPSGSPLPVQKSENQGKQPSVTAENPQGNTSYRSSDSNSYRRSSRYRSSSGSGNSGGR